MVERNNMPESGKVGGQQQHSRQEGIVHPSIHLLNRLPPTSVHSIPFLSCSRSLLRSRRHHGSGGGPDIHRILED